MIIDGNISSRRRLADETLRVLEVTELDAQLPRGQGVTMFVETKTKTRYFSGSDEFGQVWEAIQQRIRYQEDEASVSLVSALDKILQNEVALSNSQASST